MKSPFFPVLGFCLFLLSGCADQPSHPSSGTPVATRVSQPPALSTPACPAPATPEPAPVSAQRGYLVRSDFSRLPDWNSAVTPNTWTAFLAGCQTLGHNPLWQSACHQATTLGPFDPDTMRRFFEDQFTPWQVNNSNGSDQGLITGYYEPLLHGNLQRNALYRYPLYAPPADLLTIDLGDLAPDLKGRHLRGRLQGNRVVPYFSRADIELEDSPLQGQELLWVNDPVELFFLQIQGSGVILLPNGQRLHVGYADQNGYPFRSIARYLIDHHQLTLAQTSMQGIKSWARQHPRELQTLLNQNPSYVFFRLLPPDLAGPLGTLGVPLTGQASLAIDPHTIPLGVPVLLSTQEPGTQQPLTRLMMAQDTGGAIRGAVRADFFWGFGPHAEQAAGHMKEMGRLWVLYPHDHDPNSPQ
ncbi:MAG: murein transglycosylase A [Betaproteobacteria bacterium]|nr:murein transglycosylase A [Betaproteobacteria bacterium]